jgi:GDPmannose 4,6-dehydratase
MSKRALITGINSQDGSYLARLLLQKGYEVVGTLRTATSDLSRLVELGIEKDIQLTQLELLEYSNIAHTLDQVKPDELYNFAAQSLVGLSFDRPVHTGDVDAMGVARILEVLRASGARTRFYQASTSEMFGKAEETPQRETTPFHPRSPYAVAKLYAHWTTINYRDSFGMHACSGVLFNHESPLRGKEFVTRKTTLSLARMKYGQIGAAEFGNLNAKRDWGFAGDYVEGIWRMVQQEAPDDYVLATGRSRSIRDFIRLTGETMGFDVVFEGTGIDERAVDTRTGRTLVCVNPRLYRPNDVDSVVGCAEKAELKLGWKPRLPFSDLIAQMVEADERRVRNGTVSF